LNHSTKVITSKKKENYDTDINPHPVCLSVPPADSVFLSLQEGIWIHEAVYVEDGHVSECKKSLCLLGCADAYLHQLVLPCHGPQSLSRSVNTLDLVLLNRRIAENTFHLLHERKRLWFATLLLSMVCYALPYMNSMFLFLFTVSVAAVFYPSERVLLLKSHPEAINNPKDLLALIIRNYY